MSIWGKDFDDDEIDDYESYLRDHEINSFLDLTRQPNSEDQNFFTEDDFINDYQSFEQTSKNQQSQDCISDSTSKGPPPEEEEEEEEEIQFEEEEEEVQCEEDNKLEAKIMEYKEAIHNMSIPNEQNSELCNYDFENMDISEINKEIEKTKKAIETDEETFQQQMQEIQKQKEASEQVTLLRRKAIALYNELISWTQSKLETDFPDSNVKTRPPLPKDVYDNYSKDPDAIFEQILLYFKDVKKEIKRK